jgi:lipopolysaccharide transport system permease protein
VARPRGRQSAAYPLFMSEPSAADVWEPTQAGTVDVFESDTAAEAAAVPELPLWQPSTRERIREAWDSRALLPGLARTSIPTHKGKILGRAWLFLRPFTQVFGFAVIFGGVFKVQAPNGIPYLLFLILSLQAFSLFNSTLIYATTNSNAVRGVTRALRFPLLLVPFASIGYALVRLAIYWLLAAGLLVYYLLADGKLYLQVDPKMLAGIGGVALCLAFGLAIGLTTSAVFPRARDIRYFVRYWTQLLALFTPVYYPLQAIPHGYRALAQLNPLTGMVGLVQYGFLGAPGPSPYGVAWSVAALVLATLFGLWFFNRYATRWIGAFKRPEDEELLEDEGVL